MFRVAVKRKVSLGDTDNTNPKTPVFSSLGCHLYMKVRKVARVMRNGTEEKVKLARAHSLAIQRRTLISPPRIPSIALIKGISHAYSFNTLIEEGHKKIWSTSEP